MTHRPPSPVNTARSVQMNVLRASPPVLLLAITAMAIIALCQLINRADAGGKGKGGRQGHIIIQNDVKSNPVPIYMPIPIPIPMPMGGGGGGKPPGYHNHQQQRQQQQQHDGEGEVRKIYLLQPMAPARPQPHLKGGGFMGVPVQNNIHLGPGMAHHQLAMMSPGKHRHGGGGGKTSLTFDSFSEQQVPIQQQQVQEAEHKSHVKSSASEVKILPIVVIPPMAPMPPVQVPSGHQQLQAASHVPRMTLTPQFNNYVLAAGAGSHDRRRSGGGGGGGGHSRGGRDGHHRGAESFSEYGGSLGGSVFRERFAGPGGRSRPGNRARTFRIVTESEMTAGPRQQRGDFDYADNEQQQQGSSSSSISGADLRALEELMQQRRSNRWRRGDYQSQRSQQQLMNHRIKSIRDVIDLQSEQEEAAAAAASGIDDYDGQRHLSAMRGDQADGAGLSESLMSLRAGGFGQRGLRVPATATTGTMEISLDELGLAAASDQRASDYYGDRSDSLLPPATTTADGYRGPRPLRTPPSLLAGNYRLPRADERDLFDDETDEWRFDTLKSVRHAAPANETKTGSGAIGLTSLKSSSLSPRNRTEVEASKSLN